nr:hypothetical protein [Actinomycetales bacterium]
MTETPDAPEGAPEPAAQHSDHMSDLPVGLDLPAWKVWFGTILWIAGVVVSIVATVMSVRLNRRWDDLADPSGDLTMVLIRWAVALVLLVAGILLATANGRARGRAARETLRLVC